MKKLYTLLLSIPFLISCTNECPNGYCETETCPFCPERAILIYPENNQICEPGQVLSDTQATVTLQWQHAEDADRYSLTITNQSDGQTQTVDDLLENSFTLTLSRAQAYTWTVTSYNQRSNITQTSFPYQFYLQGKGKENYAPFSPILLTPESGKSIESGSVLFSWSATDLDSDPLSYTLFVDTVDGKQTPPLLQQDISVTELTIDLEPSKLYYYRVEASDGRFTSSSITRSFRTK